MHPPTGEAFGKFRGDPHLYDLAIDHRPRLVRSTPSVEAKVEELKQANFDSELFLSKAEVERQAEAIRQQLLQGPTIRLPDLSAHHQSSGIAPSGSNTSNDEDPFR